ncbi:MAG: hypothetical protein JW395_2846 [Nitrospira sp.]|nr:hypothetical protein [Nitrospira sp.]
MIFCVRAMRSDSSVWFFWMNFQSDQPNKPNKPDRPNEPAFVGRAQGKINQPPSLGGASEFGAIISVLYNRLLELFPS